MSSAAPQPDDDGHLLERAGVPAGRDPFDDRSWIRRVSGEPVVLFGGGRALLLEVAHPLVAAGVAEHSNFRADPYGRLRRTLDAMHRITFGDRADAASASRAVERAHARVRGTLRQGTVRFPAGTPYDGRDPELMCWVWATLVDTALAVYDRFVAPLPPAACESYYADHRVVARLLGVPARLVPPDYASFRAYFDGMLASDALEVTPEAREIGEAVLAPAAAAPGGGLVRSITAALLPPRLCEAFGLEWDEARAARLDAVVASVRSLRS